MSATSSKADTQSKQTRNDVDMAQAEAKLKRLIDQNQAERSLFKNMAISFKENRFGPLVFALLFAGVGGFLIFHSSAAPQNNGSAANGKPGGTQSSVTQPSITLVPSGDTVANNATVTIEVYEDSLPQAVNAVETDLIYPVDKLAFVSIDDTGSAFGVSAQKTGDSGKVVIARGTTTPVSGKQLVAKVTFKAIAASGKAAVTVNNTSQILRSDTNTNVLSSFGSVSFRLTN
jgi:hypothetical protein